MSGFFVVDKPRGVTSFSMVSLVRRLTGVRRVGHAGTLDPLATGVLPVAVGHATRLIEYLDDETKVYEATVRFGAETDTYDADGEVVRRHEGEVILSDSALREAIAGFIGEVEQRPPAYSAIKLAGKPAYRYAREGVEAELAPRRVRIDAIVVRRVEADLADIEVTCGKGTYIRSLAHDLGRAIRYGAHLEALRRTQSAGFSIDDAVPPDELARAASAGALDELIVAADRAVERFPAAIFGERRQRDVLTGRDIRTERATDAQITRVYSIQGDFMGLLRKLDGGLWRAAKVFAGPDPA